MGEYEMKLMDIDQGKSSILLRTVISANGIMLARRTPFYP